jgi:alpha-tubulin suppressor-like RCC1 family protein
VTLTRSLAVLLCAFGLAGCVDFSKLVEDCTNNERCLPEGGRIVERGEACGPLDRCRDGACVDGVCCESACEGQCEACNVSGQEGSCVAVSGAPQGGRPACGDDGSGCGGACDGSLTTACSYPAITCREHGCTAGIRTEPASCTAGACPAAVTTACPGGLCGTDSCATVLQVAAGYDYTCAVISDGTIACWGANGYGQLGLGDFDDRYVPTRVPGLTGVVEIAASSTGYHTCARTADGGLWCWGANFSGQVGIGSTENYITTPQKVSSLGTVTEVVLGAVHSCAIVRGSNSRAWCWGDNTYGQLGDGTSGNERNVPVPVCTSGSGAGCPGFIYQRDLALGQTHTCSKNSGSVYCWGSNGAGQLGFTKDFAAHPLPTAVAGLAVNSTTQSRVVFAGYNSTCALNSDNKPRCWGRNGDGQLGIGTFTGDTHVPGILCATTAGCTELTGVVSISIGEASACALMVDGSVRCWGRDGHLQLGTAISQSDHAYASTASDVGLSTGISVGSYHACAWKDAEVRCWGWSQYGQLGNDDTVTDDQKDPVAPLWP